MKIFSQEITTFLCFKGTNMVKLTQNQIKAVFFVLTFVAKH